MIKGEPALTCFGFHGAALFQLFSDDPEAIAFFSAEYAFHKATTVVEKQPSVVLRFTRCDGVLPELAGYTRHTHKVLARWAYRIEFAPQRIEIHAVGNRMSIPMIHHMLVHPSLRYLCAERQVMMLHAGAISRHGKSLIFTGHGGAGKTTTTSLVLAFGGEEWGLHADDYVFLTSGPRSMAYLTRSHLYRNLLAWVPQIKPVLTPVERLRVETFGFIRAWSGERLKWPVRLPAERLWPRRRVAVSALPVGILFLGRGEVGAPQIQPQPYSDALLDELIAMNFSEARHFLHLVQKCGAQPAYESWLAQWQERERKILWSVLHQTPIYRLILPQGAHPERFRMALVEKLNNLVASS